LITQPDHGKRPAWPHPVVANGRLYLRDGNVQLCDDVQAPLRKVKVRLTR
jgi:hypothetical protein